MEVFHHETDLLREVADGLRVRLAAHPDWASYERTGMPSDRLSRDSRFVGWRSALDAIDALAAKERAEALNVASDGTTTDTQQTETNLSSPAKSVRLPIAAAPRRALATQVASVDVVLKPSRKPQQGLPQQRGGEVSQTGSASAGPESAGPLAGSLAKQPAMADIRDRLTRIRGITPELERALNSAGVFRFSQIADWRGEDVRRIRETLDCGRQISRQAWIEQAAMLHGQAQAVQSASQPSAAPAAAPGNAASAIKAGASSPEARSAGRVKDGSASGPQQATFAGDADGHATGTSAEPIVPDVTEVTSKQPKRKAQPAEQQFVPRGSSVGVVTWSTGAGVAGVASLAALSNARQETSGPDEAIVARSGQLDVDAAIGPGSDMGTDTRDSTDTGANEPSNDAPRPTSDHTPVATQTTAVAQQAVAASHPQLSPIPITDLTAIRGITPSVARTLRVLGYTSTSEIAAATSDDIAQIATSLGPQVQPSAQNWVEQATLLAAGVKTAHYREQLAGVLDSTVPRPFGVAWRPRLTADIRPVPPLADRVLAMRAAPTSAISPSLEEDTGLDERAGAHDDIGADEGPGADEGLGAFEHTQRPGLDGDAHPLPATGVDLVDQDEIATASVASFPLGLEEQSEAELQQPHAIEPEDGPLSPTSEPMAERVPEPPQELIEQPIHEIGQSSDTKLATQASSPVRVTETLVAPIPSADIFAATVRQRQEITDLKGSEQQDPLSTQTIPDSGFEEIPTAEQEPTADALRGSELRNEATQETNAEVVGGAVADAGAADVRVVDLALALNSSAPSTSEPITPELIDGQPFGDDVEPISFVEPPTADTLEDVRDSDDTALATDITPLPAPMVTESLEQRIARLQSEVAQIRTWPGFESDGVAVREATTVSDPSVVQETTVTDVTIVDTQTTIPTAGDDEWPFSNDAEEVVAEGKAIGPEFDPVPEPEPHPGSEIATEPAPDPDHHPHLGQGPIFESSHGQLPGVESQTDPQRPTEAAQASEGFARDTDPVLSASLFATYRDPIRYQRPHDADADSEQGSDDHVPAQAERLTHVDVPNDGSSKDGSPNHGLSNDSLPDDGWDELAEVDREGHAAVKIIKREPSTTAPADLEDRLSDRLKSIHASQPKQPQRSAASYSANPEEASVQIVRPSDEAHGVADADVLEGARQQAKGRGKRSSGGNATMFKRCLQALTGDR